jgi:uncharacterized protein (UPF0218 family)
MKVMVVKNKAQREKVLSRLLKKRKVIAVVNNPLDLRKDLLKKADVVIFEERNGENSTT